MLDDQSKTHVKKRSTWDGVCIGITLLIYLWILYAAFEPYLILISDIPYTVARSRNALGWGNSSVWLVVEALCLVHMFAAGLMSKVLSPYRAWGAPAILIALYLIYIRFSTWPATQVEWRLAIWIYGPLLAITIGAWLGLRQDMENNHEIYLNEDNNSEYQKFSIINFLIGIGIGLTVIFLSVLLQRTSINISSSSIPKMVSVLGGYILLGIGLALFCVKKYYQLTNSKKIILFNRKLGIVAEMLFGVTLIIVPARMFVN